jgi:hypothetical protein
MDSMGPLIVICDLWKFTYLKIQNVKKSLPYNSRKLFILKNNLLIFQTHFQEHTYSSYSTDITSSFSEKVKRYLYLSILYNISLCGFHFSSMHVLNILILTTFCHHMTAINYERINKFFHTKTPYFRKLNNILFVNIYMTNHC